MLAPILLAAALPLLDTTLPNGLEVTILSDPSMPVVATQVWYHVGSANEDPGSRGLAHLFEHLMFGATATREKGDYSKFVTAAGGDDNAYTSPDETVYVSEVPPPALDGVLEREAERMRGLAITSENLENEKKIVTEELRLRTENDPQSRLLVKAQQALLGTHPYASEPTGEKKDVAKAQVDACRAFYDRFYRPNQAHLVVAGPVDPEATLARIRETFGPIERGGAPPEEVPVLLGWKFPARLDLKEDIPPVEIALVGVPLPAADAPDALAVEVLVEMLTSREVDPVSEVIVSERKKALAAGTESIALRRGGGIVFYSASLPYRRASTAFKLLDEALETLDRQEWLTDASLAAAKRAMLVEQMEGEYFAAQRAERLGNARWWTGSLATATDRAARIDAVTREDVARAWSAYFGSASRIRVYVKPERVPVLIRMFGWLYPLFS